MMAKLCRQHRMVDSIADDEWDIVCKDCGLKAEWCDECIGTGQDEIDPEDDEDDLPDNCWGCGGTGYNAQRDTA